MLSTGQYLPGSDSAIVDKATLEEEDAVNDEVPLEEDGLDNGVDRVMRDASSPIMEVGDVSEEGKTVVK